MQSLRPTTSRLARAAAQWPLPSPSRCPHRRLHSTLLSPTPPCLSASRGASHADESNKAAILKRPRKLPAGAPTSQLFLDLLQVSPVRARPQLINEDSARALVRAWGVDKMHDVTVVDTYSGAFPSLRPPLENHSFVSTLCADFWPPPLRPGRAGKSILGAAEREEGDMHRRRLPVSTFPRRECHHSCSAPFARLTEESRP